MTSNGEAVLNPSTPSTISAGQLDDHRRTLPANLPEPTRQAAVSTQPSPGPSSRERLPSHRAQQNGDDSDGNNNDDDDDDDAPNESEAETVVLSKDDDSKDKVIKTERTDDDDDDDDDNDDDDADADADHDDDNAARLRSVTEASANGRTNLTSDGREPKVNGAKHSFDRDAKSPVPTSPSSRTASRHAKETSPTDSVRSPVPSNTSPSQPVTRGRSSSAIESRKRKLRDESNHKSLEPPRQKAKTEGLKELRTQPNSPAMPALGRSHKRSQSTQSMVSGVAARKRRELTSLAVSTDRKHWSDDSSDTSSPRPTQTPNLPPHTRLKRGSHRALTSPARTMPHGRKVDRFGATRLARESEKGNLEEVKAAYDASPDELDQEDFAGIAPLQKAALHGWADVVEFLIGKGCRTDCESNDRDTPLIDAVENGHLDVVRILLNKGHVNPHHQNKKGQRAIDVLDHEDDDAEDIEKELKAAMRRQVDTTNNEDYSQAGAAQTKTASRLLYNEYNQETLIEKAGDGDILAVGELINSNIKPNIACGVAASRGGHYDILSILLASGLKADPDPSKHSETPMLVAIGRGHLKIVNLILEQDNFDPTRRNREGKTYWEISEERRGPKWEQERDILRNAYDMHRSTHKSPRRIRKEPPNPAAMRKRKSPPQRERSSSPRSESKRTQLTKSSSVPQSSQKPRRLMSGKEMANRGEIKRRRRVVNDETSDDDSDNEVRAPAKKPAKPRSYSEGEEQNPVQKSIKVKSEHTEPTKRSVRVQSDDSDVHRPKPTSKMRTKSERIHSAKPTPEVESPDERKLSKKSKIQSRPMDPSDKIRKRRASNDSIDEVRLKKTPSVSAKSTPAPPEKASTPEVVRERRQEEQRQAAEAKRKAVEEEARKREEEEAARKAAEEEEARKKAKAEAEAKRQEEEAMREAAEAEAVRQREEEEARRRAVEEAKRQEALAARQTRLSKLPRALRRACELGNRRPLHFAGEELGISAVFLPLFYATSKDLLLEGQEASAAKSYIMSFQAVGILGLPELDLARLDAPYSEWGRMPVTSKQRELLLRQYDVALLAQDFRFPMEGTPDFDYSKIQESIKEARQQFSNMEGLYWIEDSVLYPEMERVDTLKPLVEEIKDTSKRRRIHMVETEAKTITEKTLRPRKSFMDTVLQANGLNGVTATVNGEG